jgi:osmotically-inducible protein OsmY
MTSDRSIASSLRDSELEGDVRHYIATMDSKLERKVNVVVFDKIALITGFVTSKNEAQKAGELARQVKGILRVANHIEVRSGTSIWDEAEDATLTSKARSTLFFDSRVSSSNYNVVTFNQKIFVFGSSKSEDERNQALKDLRSIARVQKVYSFIKIGS